ncbi:hypothetical protein SBA4_6330013 [Candidatus Sulfopaludibacter sp. SbA4]|nr:hypothetical protein SBA4_6330013 [Candidatus Sulfopaludibacter sp. SbA4]
MWFPRCCRLGEQAANARQNRFPYHCITLTELGFWLTGPGSHTESPL